MNARITLFLALIYSFGLGCATSMTGAAAPMLEQDLRGTEDEEIVVFPRAPERSGDRPSARIRSRGLARINLPPVQLEFSFWEGDESAGAKAREFHLLRTQERILLTYPQVDEEWMFERNPLATDELCGLRVARASGHLIEYTDSDLFAEGIVNGWSSLAQAFVSPEEVAATQATGEHCIAFGVRFDKRVGATVADPGSLRELWWNEELSLPYRSVRATASGALRVQELRSLEDLASEQLEAASSRYPDLRRIDLADWREDVHDHGPAEAAQDGQLSHDH